MRRICSALALLLLPALGLAQTAPSKPASPQGGKTDPALAAVRAYRQANGARILAVYETVIPGQGRVREDTRLQVLGRFTRLRDES